MEIFANPALATLFIVLGIGSFVMLTAGLKSKNLVWCLYGIALSIPTFNMESPYLWSASLVAIFLIYKYSHRFY